MKMAKIRRMIQNDIDRVLTQMGYDYERQASRLGAYCSLRGSQAMAMNREDALEWTGDSYRVVDEVISRLIDLDACDVWQMARLYDLADCIFGQVQSRFNVSDEEWKKVYRQPPVRHYRKRG